MHDDDAFLGSVRAAGGWVAGRVERHPLALDVIVAALIAAASLVGLAIQGRLHDVDTIVFAIALPLPLTLRALDRRLSFATTALVALAQWLTSTPQLADAAVLWALFWVALDGDVSEVAIAALVAEAGAVMAALRWSPDDWAKIWVGVTGLAVAAAAIGLVIRERRQLVASLRERAARLELERDQEGRLGAARERARIAREMHDIVSHNLTVMIGLAGGAAYAQPDSPEMALTAIQRVSATGRQALGEMRRLLGVLRDEPESGGYEPQPDIDRLDELVARVCAAGVPVTVDVEGDPRSLSGGLQLTVFRVVQEALTNTLKHAGRPASAHVALRCVADRVTVSVTDTGTATAPSAPPPPAATAGTASGGRGLPGMRERAAAFGGQLQAGPLPEGGWRVVLELAAEVLEPAR